MFSLYHHGNPDARGRWHEYRHFSIRDKSCFFLLKEESQVVFTRLCYYLWRLHTWRIDSMDSPFSRRCWMVAAPPLLAGSSAQELLDLCCHYTPDSIAGIGSLGLLCRPRCVNGASRRKFALMEGATPCGADGGVDAVRLFPPCWLTGAPFILCFVCSALLSVIRISKLTLT